jgi:hypothetical protein
MAIVPKPFTQLHPCFVQLRFGIAHRAIHDFGDLIVLVAFHVVQHKNRPIPGRQIRNCILQSDAVNRAGQPPIIVTVIALDGLILTGVDLVQRNLLQSLLSQVHQHDIDRQPMQPRGKSGLTAKS